MAHAFNPSTGWEKAEAVECKFQTSLGYTVLKKKREKKRKEERKEGRKVLSVSFSLLNIKTKLRKITQQTVKTHLLRSPY